MIPLSNFAGQGPARVGAYRGMSWAGAYDTAGNVKEWCLNEATSGKRYILGGGADDPTYMFNQADARSPFDRSAYFGFRCAKYTITGASAMAAGPVAMQVRDYSREKPVSDKLFQVYKSLYSYDKTPLHVVVESREQSEDWTLQKITFDAAYDNERMSAYLFLPKKAKPPYQALVYFPASDALQRRTPDQMCIRDRAASAAEPGAGSASGTGSPSSSWASWSRAGLGWGPVVFPCCLPRQAAA